MSMLVGFLKFFVVIMAPNIKALPNFFIALIQTKMFSQWVKLTKKNYLKHQIRHQTSKDRYKPNTHSNIEEKIPNLQFLSDTQQSFLIRYHPIAYLSSLKFWIPFCFRVDYLRLFSINKLFFICLSFYYNEFY